MPDNEITIGSTNGGVLTEKKTCVAAGSRTRKSAGWYNDEFRFIALCTKESRMFILRRNEINGLSVKIADVSGSLFKISKF